MFPWFNVHIRSVFGPYSVFILFLLLRIITGTSTSRLCDSGAVHPKMVPLIVSSHLLNFALIVSWLNLTICDRTCTVMYRTRIISKIDFKNFLSVFCQSCVDVSSVLCRFFVYLVSMLAWFLSIFCPYSVRVIARVHRDQHKPALRLRIRPPKNGPTYCIVPLIVL